MAIEEQGIKFTLDAASFQANIAQLEKSTANYKALIDELSAAYARGDVSSEQFAKTFAEHNRDLAKQTQLLEAMKGAQKENAAATANASSTTSAWGAVMASANDQAAAMTKRLEDAAQAARDKAAADQKAVASANDLLGRMTLSADAVQADTRAAIADAAAKRQLANAADGAAREEAHLNAVIRDGIGEMLVEARQTTTLADAKRKLATASGNATNKMAGFGQTALQTGRVVQDFAQGGLGGIINNIEGFAMALGMGAGAAGALTLVGVAALVAAPHVKEFYASLTGSSNEIPKNADSLKRLDGELAKISKKLDEYREKQSLTNVELKDYNKLSAEQIELERQKNEEAERRNALAGVTGIVGKEQAERAAGFREAVAEAGGGERAAAQLRQALENTGVDFDEAAKKADELLIDAGKGIKSAIEEIRTTVRAGLAEKDQKLADAIQGSTPEAKKSAREGEAKDKADLDAKDKNDKLVDTLNEQGQQATAEWDAEQAKQDAADEKAGLKGATKAQREAKKQADDRKAADLAERKQGEQLGKQYSAASTVDEQAALLARQLGEAGGMEDKYGRFKSMTPEQQQKFVQQEVTKYLKSQGVGGQNAAMASGSIAANATLQAQHEGLGALQDLLQLAEQQQMKAHQNLEAIRRVRTRIKGIRR